jgi:hypothetical protein
VKTRLGLLLLATVVACATDPSADPLDGGGDGAVLGDGGIDGSGPDGSGPDGSGPDGSVTDGALPPTSTACSDGAGAVYYVAPTGNDAVTCVQAQQKTTPKKTIAAALGCLTPGDNLHLLDGVYAGASNALTQLPSGSQGKYVTVSAENPGAVIVQAGLTMAHTNAWIQVRGLRFHDTAGRTILGNHAKFCGNEFKGGCASGNCVNTVVGTNDFADTADILLEDDWWHGPGGRYDLLVYNANRVVVRRGVIRHDAGWTDAKDDPEAGMNFYNTSNSSAQNVIILDNDLSYHTWQGAFYSVYNSASPNATTGNSFLGDIALKSPVGGAFRLDGNGPISATVEDMVLWDAQYAAAMGSGSCKVTVTMNRITAGRSKSGSGSGFVQYGASYTGTITNTILANVAQPTDGTSLTTFDSFGNGGTPAGTGGVTYSPFTSGLLYLPRIEAGSKLATAGQNGGQLGARIVNRIGAPGSLYGEAGWNTDTGTPLWPFPNEARIKKEMCTDAGVTRGFCADTSLTHYVMNVLGNGNPY